LQQNLQNQLRPQKKKQNPKNQQKNQKKKRLQKKQNQLKQLQQKSKKEEPKPAEPAQPAEVKKEEPKPEKPAEEPKKADPVPEAKPVEKEPVVDNKWPKANKAINRKISHWTGDITTLEIDAVVNAANSSLLGGGGIDGAIHSAAGDNLYRECLTLNGTPTGTTKITRGYNLPAKYILHTVGPHREDPEKLESCYVTVLELVKKHKIRSIAICGISTGIFGYPLEPASRIACATVRKWLEIPENLAAIDRVIFCTFLKKEEDCYDDLLQEYFPVEADPEFVKIWADSESGYKSTEELTQSSTSSEEEPVAAASDSSEEDGDALEGVPDIIFGSATLKNGSVDVTVNGDFLKKWEDFHYQVTPIGKYAQLYISKEIEDGKFTIASADKVDVEVHWQVRGEAW